MSKSADAFRTISEVAEWLGVQTHVLRFWESKFSQVRPVKRAGGRRYYRPQDMLLLGGIRQLLHEDGLTIKGVQKVLREEGVAHVAGLSKPLDDLTAAQISHDAPPAVSPPEPEAAQDDTPTLPFAEDLSANAPAPEAKADSLFADPPTESESAPQVTDSIVGDIDAASDEVSDLAPAEEPEPHTDTVPQQPAPPESPLDDLDEPASAPMSPAPVPAAEPAEASPEPEFEPTMAAPEPAAETVDASPAPDPLAAPLEPAPDPSDTAPMADMPEPEVVKPKVIDAPDGPAPEDIPADPGILTLAALKVSAIPPEAMAPAADLAARLTALRDRMAAAGNGPT